MPRARHVISQLLHRPGAVSKPAGIIGQSINDRVTGAYFSDTSVEAIDRAAAEFGLTVQWDAHPTAKNDTPDKHYIWFGTTRRSGIIAYKAGHFNLDKFRRAINRVHEAEESEPSKVYPGVVNAVGLNYQGLVDLATEHGLLPYSVLDRRYPNHPVAVWVRLGSASVAPFLFYAPSVAAAAKFSRAVTCALTRVHEANQDLPRHNTLCIPGLTGTELHELAVSNGLVLGSKSAHLPPSERRASVWIRCDPGEVPRLYCAASDAVIDRFHRLATRAAHAKKTP